jgi:hypothetical protein
MTQDQVHGHRTSSVNLTPKPLPSVVIKKKPRPVV